MGTLVMLEIGKRVPEAKTWQRILFNWSKALNHYLAFEKKGKEDFYDLSHWHNERAQVGFLAGAVWRMGGAALEEYRTGRADADKIQVTETTPGRCDLYIAIDKLYCAVESKLEWLTSYSSKNALQVENKLRQAHDQLKKLDMNDHVRCKGLALCWGVATKSDSVTNEQHSLCRFADGLKKPDRVLAVYHAPFRIRRKVEARWGDKKESYPGVIFIGETHRWE